MPFESEKGDLKKIEHNSSVCVFEFKLFVCYFIAFGIPTKFVILFLAHPMVQKIVEIDQKLNKLCPLKMKVICKMNITIEFVFLSLNFLYIVPLPSTLKNIL